LHNFVLGNINLNIPFEQNLQTFFPKYSDLQGEKPKTHAVCNFLDKKRQTLVNVFLRKTNIRNKDMPIEEFIISVYWCIENLLNKVLGSLKLRRRGFSPKFTDGEILTLEIVGEFLGMETDKSIWEYFKRHWNHWFPNIPSRTTFVRQAANLWQVKQIMQKDFAISLGALSDSLHIIDGFPISVCHFARARRGKLFKGEAGYGRCSSKNEVYFGFKGHLVINGSGLISSLMITPANVEEHQPVEELVKGMSGILIGDKGFISNDLKERLKRTNVALETPLKKNMKDSRSPEFLLKIKSIRRLIETVIGQLNDRFHFNVVWARDYWHLLSRLGRKALAHTMGIFLNRKLERPPIRFDGLLAI
jgi:hypothetical protein